jgi:hypothetical protein
VYRRSEKIREDNGDPHPGASSGGWAGLPQHHIENSALEADFSGRSGVVDLLIDLEGGL